MTTRYRIAALLILAVFYGIYFGKMLAQRKRGIRTVAAGRDKTDKRRYRVEQVMMRATPCAAAAELLSIVWGYSAFGYSMKGVGIALGIAGDLFFLAAVLTMRDSWRAGVAAEEHRAFVSKGVFNISRNPAFLGFDLVYLGILLLFFNWFLFAFTLWAAVMLHLQILEEEKYLTAEFGETYTQYKKKVCRYFGRKSFVFGLAVLLIVGAAGAGFALSLKSKTAALPGMSFEECLRYTAAGNTDTVITVGTLKNGEMSYTVYGEDGLELPQMEHVYEIGSLTKTMTAALVWNAVQQGKIDLDASVSRYVTLPEGKVYPTIRQLLTHTAGYKSEYVTVQMAWNTLTGCNPFRFQTAEKTAAMAFEKTVTGEHPWQYSNFGYALLGMTVEAVYGDTWCATVNAWLREKGLTYTAFTRSGGDLGNYWKWELRDAYAAAGAVRSTIGDMLRYAEIMMEDAQYAPMSEPLVKITARNARYEAMGIRTDAVGMAWILDEENDIVWHNGGTGNYNCYLGFSKEKGTAVVVLSNLPPDYRIPATVLGTKLLKELNAETD